MGQAEVEAVRPGAASHGDVELRVRLAVVPLRIRLDQNVADYLLAFAAPAPLDEGDGELIEWEDALSELDGTDPENGPGVPTALVSSFWWQTDQHVFFTIILSWSLVFCTCVHPPCRAAATA